MKVDWALRSPTLFFPNPKNVTVSIEICRQNIIHLSTVQRDFESDFFYKNIVTQQLHISVDNPMTVQQKDENDAIRIRKF